MHKLYNKQTLPNCFLWWPCKLSIKESKNT